MLYISRVVSKSDRDHGTATTDNRKLGLTPAVTISRSNLSLGLYPILRRGWIGLGEGGKGVGREGVGEGLTRAWVMERNLKYYPKVCIKVVHISIGVTRKTIKSHTFLEVKLKLGLHFIYNVRVLQFKECLSKS